MEWTADVTAGEWVRERLDDVSDWGPTMHGVVPRGFAAYARVFHPTFRTRPHSETVEPARWADAAASFGTTLHPLAQWSALVRTPSGIDFDPNVWQEATSPDGWQYNAPEEGSVDEATVARIAAHLTAATTTPDDGFVTLWAGWGGLLGFIGETPSRTFFTFDAPTSNAPVDPEVAARHDAMLARSTRDPFNNVFLKPVWQPGILSDEISKGPRLELPAREHVLFAGGVCELARDDWFLDVPWRDREGEAHGFEPSAQSPSLIWPADRAWVCVTEVDYDSTIIGGSPELVAAICADPLVEALPLPADADLTYDGDRVNG